MSGLSYFVGCCCIGCTYRQGEETHRLENKVGYKCHGRHILYHNQMLLNGNCMNSIVTRSADLLYDYT